MPRFTLTRYRMSRFTVTRDKMSRFTVTRDRMSRFTMTKDRMSRFTDSMSSYKWYTATTNTAVAVRVDGVPPRHPLCPLCVVTTDTKTDTDTLQ